MTARSIGQLLVLCAVLGAAAVAAYVFYIAPARHEPAREAAAPAAAAPSQSPSAARDESAPAATVAAAKTAAAAADAHAVAALAEAVSPGAPPADKSELALDVVRIEPTGEAVIAGRAAPGAVVDLLRGGERLDQVVADSSGQFAMVPPRLPSGSYELTLSARSPDGTLATSKHGVAVALNDTTANSGAARPRAAEAQPSAETPAPAAPRPSEPASQPPDTTGTVTAAAAGSALAAAAPGISTRVVSRGDSLWRISRVTYGAGTQYMIIYKANRERVRNPDRIYPGQTLVLPAQGH